MPVLPLVRCEHRHRSRADTTASQACGRDLKCPAPLWPRDASRGSRPGRGCGGQGCCLAWRPVLPVRILRRTGSGPHPAPRVSLLLTHQPVPPVIVTDSDLCRRQRPLSEPFGAAIGRGLPTVVTAHDGAGLCAVVRLDSARWCSAEERTAAQEDMRVIERRDGHRAGLARQRAVRASAFGRPPAARPRMTP